MMKLLKILRYIISAAFFGMIAFLLLDLVLWFTFGVGWGWWKWDSVGPIAISDGYSIEIQTRPAHPFLAEYDQRVVVYGGDARNGTRRGMIPLHMNTGGRTYLEIERATTPDNKPLVLLTDRYGTDIIQLNDLSRSLYAQEDILPNERRRIGIVSGEAYPNKFIAPDALVPPGTLPERSIEPAGGAYVSPAAGDPSAHP